MSTAFPISEERCASDRYSQRVNPEWVRLLNLVEMNVRYERCVGAGLFTSDGRRIIDFLSGYCVHAVGHNDGLVRALEPELERCGPAMIQTHVADLAGELAEKLCQKAGARLVVSDQQLDAVGAAVQDVGKLAHSPGAFWGEALGLARRAFRA